MSNSPSKNKPLRRDAEIIFDARNVPISAQFDDPYFSFNNGLAESEYVFLNGNQLTKRLKGGFSIAELGFGTGLNFLLTWRLWRSLEATGQIRFTSFEAFPMNKATRQKSLAQFPALAELIEEFEHGFTGDKFETPEIQLQIHIGDANQTLPQWQDQADAWFLDGFSPAKNPELWNKYLMKEVHNHTAPQGSFATYSAAGFVRRNLQEAGFITERIKGFGHKRHMLIGYSSDAPASSETSGTGIS